MAVIGSILAVVAVLLLVVGGLAWTRRLPGNKYVGIKVPEVRVSQEVWDIAHQLAGPLWVASGIAMAVASAPFFSGMSWLLVISVVGIIASAYFFGLGSSIGARAAGVIGKENNSDSCCGGSDSATNEEQPPAEPAPAPQVDIEALRRAAGSADS